MPGALEELISVGKALDAKLDIIIANQANGTPLPSATETKTRKTKATETAVDKAAAASVSADQVRAEFDRIKALPNAQIPALKKVIEKVGYSALAELLTHPEKFDEAMTELKAYETSLTAADDPDDL